jgi:flagellar motility protein MotE (MotC chaperone)
MKLHLSFVFAALLVVSEMTGQVFAEGSTPAELAAPSIDLCRSFADKAAESRFFRHKQELLELKASIETKLAVLQEKTTHLEDLVARRAEVRAAVSAGLVKMYSNVEPEVAARQLEKLNVDTVSEVLQRLNPKISGEIITAMDAKLARKVVQVMLMNSASVNAKASVQ